MTGKGSGAITRIIRFISNDEAVYVGEEPSDNSGAAEVLSGNVLEPSTLKRTGDKKPIVRLLAPVLPPNIFCIGLNYMKHYEEFSKKRGVALPSKPVVFMKPTTAVTGPHDGIPMPNIVNGDLMDWEVELTIVIGKECRNVKASEALHYVLGYTVGNDVSSRHWQKQAGAGQWIKGKGFDSHCPLGPVLVTKEEIPDPQALRVTTRVNGAVQQDEFTKDMIFTCAEIIEWLSNNMTLLPGTVILTGTPAGVAAGRSPPNWLKVGDVLESEISGIGVLSNTVLSPIGPKL